MASSFNIGEFFKNSNQVTLFVMKGGLKSVVSGRSRRISEAHLAQ